MSKAVKAYVRRAMPKAEMKQIWSHTNESLLSTLTQGYVTSGPLCGAGTGPNSRIGNDITLHGLHLKGALYNNSAGETYVRCVVVGYPGTNGNPTLNLFRGGPGGLPASVTTVVGLDAMYYPLNKTQLHIYHDKVFKLAGNVNGNSGSNTRMFNKFFKFGGRKISYLGDQSGEGKQNWLYSVIWIAADASDDTTSGTSVDLSQMEIAYFKDS